jgi:formylglycine-generating enzyme required for sulfatase activity
MRILIMPAQRRLVLFILSASLIALALISLSSAPSRAQDEVPTATPSVTPSPTATLIPAGTLNSNWTSIIQEINGIPMVYVPAGCFMMGSEDGGVDEKPVHRVCLSAFRIGQTEVTNAQYRRCVEARECTPPEDLTRYDDPTYADHPVVEVNWQQVSDFAAWAGGSLPTEAQWEYAARGPEAWTYPWGNSAPACEQVNISGCDGGTAPVGPDQRVAGASWVGALDMSGNVLEWTADWYDGGGYDGRYYATLPDGVLNPVGPVFGIERVVRGDAFSVSTPRNAAWRDGNYEYLPALDLGFRIMMPAD